jgi:hypothetical protein
LSQGFQAGVALVVCELAAGTKWTQFWREGTKSFATKMHTG